MKHLSQFRTHVFNIELENYNDFITLVPIEKKDGSIKMKQQRQFYCRTGSFQKSYEENSGGYATGKLMRPSDLGTMKIQIGFHRDRTKGDERLITDIEATI